MNQQTLQSSTFEFAPVHMGRVLLGLANDFRRRVLDHCREHGHPKIRGSHSSLLTHIGRTPINLTTLSERSAITQQAVGKLVRELERMGYVECHVDDRDKRAKLIKLSPRGLTLMNDLEEINEEVRCEYRAVLGDNALTAFEEQLSCTARALHIGERRRGSQN
jgi:DNA-binding MarR family transcriptional regulator